MSINELLGIAVGIFGSSAWFWYDKKKSDKELENLKRKITTDYEKSQDDLKEITVKMVEHTNIHITEERSRQIAEEVCGRIEKNVTETKIMVQALVTQVNLVASTLQTHTAVHKAISDHEKNKK
jgi:Skp family chaperone for outer membrane proteins